MQIFFLQIIQKYKGAILAQKQAFFKPFSMQ